MTLAALLIGTTLYEAFYDKLLFVNNPRILPIYITLEVFLIGDMVVELLSGVFNLYREYRTTYRWNASLSTPLYKRDINGELEQISEPVNFEFYHDIPTSYKLQEILANYIWYVSNEERFDDVSNEALCEWINMNTNYLAARNAEDLERLQMMFYEKNRWIR